MFPWYDSWWLSAFSAARRTLRQVNPAVLDRFEGEIDVLRTRPDFEVQRADGLLDAAALDGVRRVIASLGRDELSPKDIYEARTFGRFITRNHPAFTELQARLAPLVSEAAGEPVEPSYNFLSLYGAPGVCAPHIDAPPAKWTLDICVDQSAPWPIHFSQVVPWPESGVAPAEAEAWADAIKRSPGLRFTPVTLEPGQAVIFSGSSQWHYRDRMPRGAGRQFCDLLFFHYIPAGTSDLVWPDRWADRFGVPELGGLGAAPGQSI